jgi:hypothetical protein
MTNILNVKYESDWDYAMFEYKNYGFSLTRQQGRKALAQWIWCKHNLK